MLLKWIQCTVPDASRAAFAEGQAGWRALAGVPGFVAQAGGWDTADRDVACVLGLWASREACDAFMRDRHDAIEAATRQQGTYTSIEVATFETRWAMPGTCQSLAEAFVADAVMRIADCRVRPGREDAFRDAQRTVWTPGMQAAGMRAGELARRKGEARYLVATVWPDEATHEAYRAGPFPELRRRAAPERDVERLASRVVGLRAEWVVVP